MMLWEIEGRYTSAREFYRLNRKQKMEVRMSRKYSVFISNVGSCMDRYCAGYGRNFSIEELFERVKSIPLLSAVDIVLTKEFKENLGVVKECLVKTGLELASVAVDTFANPIYQKGSFANIDSKIRTQAIEDAKFAIDFAAEMGM